ncbi:MAG: FemAB family XrtA/PEP-CTERM system-associated protein [Thermoanaerobaculia bacterium]
MNLKTALAGPSDKERWDAFVARHPAGSCCHAFGWSTVFQHTYRKDFYFLYATADRDWVGVLPLVHLQGPLAGNRLVSLPYLDQGGILTTSDEAARALEQAAFRLARETGATGLDLRGPSRAASPAPEESKRFRFLLDLEGSEEKLWQAIGPKVRNQIRKSESSGLISHRVGSERLDDFFPVFARNMRDLGSPTHSRRFFAEIFSAFDSAAGLYLTLDAQESPVAGGVSIAFGDTVTVPWASSLRSARSACPNHSLYWRVLRDARREGADRFDFGRSSVGTGTFHFKKQWRATPEPLMWEFYAADGSAESEPYLDPRKHSHLAAAWRRLPMSLANLLGPLVRRQLAN